MPPPDVLAGYEQMVPGAAERILRIAEASTTERAALEHKLVDAEIEADKQGRALAFMLGLTAMIGAIVFFALRNPIAGSVLLSMPVVLLIKSMIPERR